MTVRPGPDSDPGEIDDYSRLATFLKDIASRKGLICTDIRLGTLDHSRAVEIPPPPVMPPPRRSVHRRERDAAADVPGQLGLFHD